MINVSSKQCSLRYAIAKGILTMRAETLEYVKTDTVPKGNVLATARAAGIAAAKKTSDWITFCHPIPLDWVEVYIETIADGLQVTTEVESVWKTGVEMEAMTGVMGALINAYDMLKPLDPDMEISKIRILEKRGGKNQFLDTFESSLKTAVLVISDSTHAGTRQDRSGQLIKKMLLKYPISVETYDILPDDPEKIQARVLNLVEKEKYDLVITTGGTGFGPKDYTPEALSPILEKLAPGVVERLRSFGGERTPYAMLSREIAGSIGSSLILTFPGSSKGARESTQALFPGILHIFPMLWGYGHNKDQKRISGQHS